MVNVKFDLRGREYNGQYYVDLNAWRIERGDQAGGAEAGQQPAAVSAAPMPPVPPMPLPHRGRRRPALLNGLHGWQTRPESTLERALDAYALGFNVGCPVRSPLR